MKHRHTINPAHAAPTPMKWAVQSMAWLLFGLWMFQGNATFQAAPAPLPQATCHLDNETNGATALSPDWVWEDEESSIDLIDDADDDEAHGDVPAELSKTAPPKHSSTGHYLRTACANVGTVPLYILYRQMKTHLA